MRCVLVCSGEVEKMSVKMKEVESCDVPVVDEVFLENAETGGALLKIPSHTISGWGAPRHALPSAAQELESAGVCSPTSLVHTHTHTHQTLQGPV